jgi:hypothetical protein
MSVFKSSNDSEPHIGVGEMNSFLYDALGRSYNYKREVDHIFTSAGALGVDLPNGNSIKPHKFSEFYGAQAGNPYWDNDITRLFAATYWTRNVPHEELFSEKNSTASYSLGEGAIFNGGGKWVTYGVTSYYNNTTSEMPFFPEIDNILMPYTVQRVNAGFDMQTLTSSSPVRTGPTRAFHSDGSSIYGDETWKPKAMFALYQNGSWYNFLASIGASFSLVGGLSWSTTTHLFDSQPEIPFRDAYREFFDNYPAFNGSTQRYDYFGRNNLQDTSVLINLDNSIIKLHDPGHAVTDNSDRILLYNEHIPFNGVKTVDNWDGMYHQVWMMKTSEAVSENSISVDNAPWYQKVGAHAHGYIEIRAHNGLKYHIEKEVISGTTTYSVKNESNQVLFSQGSSSSSGIASAKSQAIAYWENLHFRGNDYDINQSSYVFEDGIEDLWKLQGRKTYNHDWIFSRHSRWQDDGQNYNIAPYNNYELLQDPSSALSRYRRDQFIGSLKKTGYSIYSYDSSSTYSASEYVFYDSGVYVSTGNVPVNQPPVTASGGTNFLYWSRTSTKTINHKHIPRLDKSTGLKLYLNYEIDMQIQDKIQIQRAARLWEQIIQDDIEIEVYIFPSSRARAVGGVLASATPFRSVQGNYLTNPLYPKAKVDQILVFIDTEDIYHPNASGRNIVSNPIIPGATELFYIMFHEIAHGLGLGTNWNEDSIDGFNYGDLYNFLHTNSYGAQYGGQAVGYRGSNCLREYQVAMQNAQYIKVYSPSAQNIITVNFNYLSNPVYTDSVPIQDSSQQDTLLGIDYGGHFSEFAKVNGVSDWESEANSSPETYIQPTFGDEIMSPIYNNPRAPISKITLGAIEDLGYTVDYGYGQTNEIPIGYTGTAYLHYLWYQQMTATEKAFYNNDLSQFLESNSSSYDGQLNEGPHVRKCSCKRGRKH